MLLGLSVIATRQYDAIIYVAAIIGGIPDHGNTSYARSIFRDSQGLSL